MYSIGLIMWFLNIKACQHILLHQIIIFKIASYDPFKFLTTSATSNNQTQTFKVFSVL